jgi:hypothetical protein
VSTRLPAVSARLPAVSIRLPAVSTRLPADKIFQNIPFSFSVKMVPPSKPKVTKLSDNSVMLQWLVSDNDGLRITFFRVQYRELSNNKKRGGWETIEDDIPEGTRQYEVAGLKPGATYKFRIAAVYENNDNKLGPSSGRFKLSVEPARRQHPPVTGPVIVEAKSMSPTDIAIRWKVRTDIEKQTFIISYKYNCN